jgi:phage/conjugal plasmid C-4 type zinc finger TraR family protein
MDQADIADQVITEHLERAIAAARGIRTENQLSQQRFIYCSDCGDEIPEKRREILPGCKRCISCEEDHESRNHNQTRRPITHDNVDEMIDDIVLSPA